MRKMPCLFQRVFHGRNNFTMHNIVTPGCEWVIAGEGIASRKRDGTACMVLDGKLYKRYDAKNGKPAPSDGIPCEPSPDPVTGHWPHWVPVKQDDPASKWHAAAWCEVIQPLSDGTYELCGPHFSPAEALESDVFFQHGSEKIIVDRSFEGIKAYLTEHNIEGIVFAHPDGRMVKIRRDDYGLAWKPARKA